MEITASTHRDLWPMSEVNDMESSPECGARKVNTAMKMLPEGKAFGTWSVSKFKTDETFKLRLVVQGSISSRGSNSEAGPS